MSEGGEARNWWPQAAIVGIIGLALGIAIGAVFA